MAAHQLVYHWKHGWIPLDHFAALQKAHGSHKGAARIMQKHGITPDAGRHGESHGSAKLQIRPGFHQGATGHHIVGHDTRGRRVKVFVGGDRSRAEKAAENIRAGRPAFEAAPTPNAGAVAAAHQAAQQRDSLRRDLFAKYRGQGAPYLHQVHGIDPSVMSTPDLKKLRDSLHAEHPSSMLESGRKLRALVDAEHGKRSSAPKAPKAGPKRFAAEKLDQRLIDKGIAGGSTHVVRDNHDGGNVARHENGGLAYFKSAAEAKRFAETHNARHDAGREATPQELHRREMARIDAKDARARRAAGESFAASQRAARQKSLQEKAAGRVAERRRLAESAAAGHTGNDAAIGVRKSGSKYETFHTPSGLRITEHSSKSDAELTRKEMVTTPHNLNVAADELRKSPAMEHLRTSAERAREAEQRKKTEASRVAAAKKLRPAGAPVSNPSKPGDLAVFSTKDRVAVIGKSDGVVEHHTPGVVTHVGKDGRVVAMRDARGELHTVDHRTEVRTMPQDQIDAHGLMAHVAATNRYGTSEHLKTHYDSMAEVQAAARQFRKDGPDAPAAAAVVSVPLDANRQGRLKSYSTPVLEGMLARADVSAQSKAFIRALLAERRARTSNRAG